MDSDLNFPKQIQFYEEEIKILVISEALIDRAIEIIRQVFSELK